MARSAAAAAAAWAVDAALGVLLVLLHVVASAADWAGGLWRLAGRGGGGGGGGDAKKLPLHVAFALDSAAARRHPAAVERLVRGALDAGVRVVTVFDSRGAVAARAGRLAAGLGREAELLHEGGGKGCKGAAAGASPASVGAGAAPAGSRAAGDAALSSRSGGSPAKGARAAAAAAAPARVRVVCASGPAAVESAAAAAAGAPPAKPAEAAPAARQEVWLLGAADSFGRVASVIRGAARAGPGAAAELRRRPSLLRELAAGPRPDPELVVVAGEAPSLLGFPPWLLRVAEIVRLPPLGGVTDASFAGALARYQRTTQRFGR